MTYAASVGLHVGGAPVVGVRGGRAAAAVAGRRSGDDHVAGRVVGLKSQQES